MSVAYEKALQFINGLWSFHLFLSIITATFITRIIMSSKPSKMPGANQAYILHTSVTHGRYLPSESKHTFTYPALFMLVSLRALESGRLNLGFEMRSAWGWVFGYGKAKRRLVAIEPWGYLSSGREGEGETIMERLEDLLERDADSRVAGDEKKQWTADDAWMLTMPSLVGWKGINPLTVYFVYSRGPGPEESELTCVVLEVHNTFGESHAYILKIGEREDGEEQRGRGYDHQWTFPRQFHVSPFNDRSGYYTVGVKRPTHSPPFDAKLPRDVQPPKPTVRIQLYTSPAEAPFTASTRDPRGELKLTAVLRPTEAIPLTGLMPLLRSLMKMPFALLLTMTRIHYQAWILHFGKPRLGVYLKPEMKWPTLWGRGSPGEDERTSGSVGVGGGGLKWIGEGSLERYARWRLEKFLERRVDDVGIQVTLVPANPAMKIQTWTPEFMQSSELDGKDRHLRIGYLSSKLFTTLLLAPSAEHALLVGADTEAWFQVSSRHLFINVLKREGDVQCVSREISFLQRLRARALPRASAGMSKKSHIPIPVPHRHFLDRLATSGSVFSVFEALDYLCLLDILNYAVISARFLLDGLEEMVFSLVRVRVARGQEPWLLWEKAANVYWGEDVDNGLGSVRSN